MKLRELLAVTEEHVIVLDDFDGGLVAPSLLERYGYLNMEVTKIEVTMAYHDLAVYVHDPDND